MFFAPRPSRLFLVWIVGSAISLTHSVCQAQPNAVAHPESGRIEAIFRISRPLLEEVIDREITADIPFCETIINFRCSTIIQGKGRMSLELLSGGGESVFEIRSQGTANACVRGVRGPIVASGPAWGTFASRTLVGFDGKRFRHLQTTPEVKVCASVGRVTGRYDRAAGRLFGKGAMPIAEKMIPRAVAEATPYVRRDFGNLIEEKAGEVITQLNQQTPIQETADRLFPKTRDWVFQVSDAPSFMQAAFGPPGAPLPDLPEAPSTIADAGLEVWLRSTNDEARLLANLSRQPLANALVQRTLESSLPELARIADRRSVQAVGEWVVIRIGKPDLSGLQSQVDLNSLSIPR